MSDKIGELRNLKRTIVKSSGMKMEGTVTIKGNRLYLTKDKFLEVKITDSNIVMPFENAEGLELETIIGLYQHFLNKKFEDTLSKILLESDFKKQTINIDKHDCTESIISVDITQKEKNE